MKKIINIFCLFIIFFIFSCNNLKTNREDDKYEHKVFKLLKGADYTIFEVKNDIIYEVLDSLFLMIPKKIYSNRVLELYFDTSNFNTNQTELVFNLILIRNFYYDTREDVLQLYERIGDGGFSYKDIAILVHCHNNEKFNDYFIDTGEIAPINFHFDGGSDYYMEEPYKQNKELIPFTCSFRVKLVDNKISEITSNCDSVSFKWRVDLFKLYGYER